jgi:3D (Asp-Asp-Asp) domain-containing protein
LLLYLAEENKRKGEVMMKILAGRSAILSLITLFVGLFYIQPTVGEAFDKANDPSREGILTAETNNNLFESIKTTTDDKPESSTEDKKAAKASLKTNLFKATAYCLKGRTASGGGVRRGIVAADPRVLPLGTRIQITSGSYSGTYLVADTGGAVRGRILDIWVPNCSEAIRFGRKSISVSVLGR